MWKPHTLMQAILHSSRWSREPLDKIGVLERFRTTLDSPLSLIPHVDRIDQPLLISQILQPLQCFVKWNQSAVLLGCLIISISNVESPSVLLFGTNNYKSLVSNKFR